MSKIIPVILSGGSGTRLWPVSRAALPKQLQRLVGPQTMIQSTALRMNDSRIFRSPVIVCGGLQTRAAKEQLDRVGVDATYIVEPMGKNTAPAAAAVSAFALEHNEEALILILPADHHIEDLDKFYRAVNIATEAAAAGHLVTFGIVPTEPKTGYGYIRSGDALGEGFFGVGEFKEKPNREKAEQYLSSGEYYWNSGMFLFSAQAFLDELNLFRPKIKDAAISSFQRANRDSNHVFLSEEEFRNCPSESIDYAVMEHTSRAAVVPAEFAWSDVGAWDALWEIGKSGADNNVIEGDVLTSGVTSCYIRSTHRLVAAVGLTNTIVVETADAVLVAGLGHSEMVKAVVEELKEASRNELTHHLSSETVYGTLTSILSTDRLCVRVAEVLPGRIWEAPFAESGTSLLAGLTGDVSIVGEEGPKHIEEDLTLTVSERANLAIENKGREPVRIVAIDRLIPSN